MINIKTALQSAISSEAANDRLASAALLAANYNARRDNDAAQSHAAASFAADVLGIKVADPVKTGQSTTKGLQVLVGKEPIKAVLVAIAKQDRDLKRALFWGLDAARRAAAVEAYRVSTAAATAEEAAAIAGELLGTEPYAGAEESSLYPESGHAAQVAFEEDSLVWEALQMLLAQGGDRVPRLARFWAEGFEPIYCDSWEDVEAFLAK